MDLQELRNEINDIDSQLQELFNKRMQISFKVAEYKIANNMPVFVHPAYVCVLYTNL